MGERTGGNRAVPFLREKRERKKKRKCRKVTLFELRGPRMQTAASSYHERITITGKVRKAFKGGVGGCSAAAAGRQAEL